MKKTKILFCLTFLTLSCVNTKSTLKNVDNTALKPQIIDNHFVITEISNENKYGYDKDYPINIGFSHENEAQKNINYFFNALLDKNNESFTYEKIETCCPFPTKRTSMGVGTLDIYEITFSESGKKIKLHFNIYEKGKILCPIGFKIKN